jgi:formylglycine-generating enzyme required for sulfatase activity
MDKTPAQLPLSLEEFAFQTPLLDPQGVLLELREGHAQQFLEQIAGPIALAMLAIPGGTFQMGSPHGQGYDDETPRHLVSLAPFFLSRYPITQAQWQAVMGHPARGRFEGEQLPVENVSWREAQDFCERLSRKTGRAYGLPSEAQWEYACRAGASTPFSTGDTITTDYANYCGDHRYRSEPRGQYRHVTTPVDRFPPNAFGVSDLHANVWEFCADRWHPDYTGAPFDGRAWKWGGEEGFRVTRGGSWHEPPVNCRCATRLRVSESERDDYYGFRVALNYPE